MAALSNEAAMRLLAAAPMMQPPFPGGAGMPRPMMPPNIAAALGGLDQANQFRLHQMMMSQNVPPEIPAEMQHYFNRSYMADPSLPGGFHPYMGFDGGRRKNATREITMPLKEWLNSHRKNPYPTKQEKLLLACMTGMTMTQVSTWFANARRRLKKENKMTWSPRHGRNDSDDEDEGDDSTPDVSLSDEKTAGIVVDALESPKKPKIWSIADTLNPRADSAASNVSGESKASLHAKEEPKSPSTSTPTPNAMTSTAAAAANFQNPMMMAFANRMNPNFYPAFMAQQAAAQQAQQAAAQQAHQQQLSAMLRSVAGFPQMFMHPLFGMNGMAALNGLQMPSTSESSTSGSPPPADNSASTSASTSDRDTTTTTVKQEPTEAANAIHQSQPQPSTSTTTTATTTANTTATSDTTTTIDSGSNSPTSTKPASPTSPSNSIGDDCSGNVPKSPQPSKGQTAVTVG